MDSSIRSQLVELKTLAQTSLDSELPKWISELLVSNVRELLDTDASNSKVANDLAGGLRAISDVLSADENPIVRRMVSIVDEAELAAKMIHGLTPMAYTYRRFAATKTQPPQIS